MSECEKYTATLSEILALSPVAQTIADATDVPGVRLEWLNGAWYGDCGFPSADQHSALLAAGAYNSLATNARATVNGQQVTWGGAGVGWVETEPGIYPAGDTYESALAAINAAYAAGGGTVKFGRVTIDLGGNYLPLKKGVNLVGEGFSIAPGSNCDDEDTSVDLTKGTVLIGNGTAPGLWDEKVDRLTPYGDYSYQDEFMDDMLQISIKGIGIQNCTYGIKIGANYAPGACYGRIEQVMTARCTQWGVWFENFIHYEWNQIYCYGNLVGQMMFMFSSTHPLLCANNNIGEIVASAPRHYNVRGIELRAKNTTGGGWASANLIQSNKFYPNSLAPVAFTSDSSGNITVPDGSKFFVDLPIYFPSVGTSGLKANKTYIVRTVAGNVITIGEDHRTTKTTAAGSGTVGSMGRALLALIAETHDDGLAAPVIQSLDLEGWCTTRLLIDGQDGACYAGNNLMVGSTSINEVTVRNSHRLLFYSTANPTTWDFSNTAVNNMIFGIIGSFRDSVVPYCGIIAGGDGAGAMNLSSSGQITLKNVRASGGDFSLPGLPIGRASSERTYIAGQSSLGIGDKCDMYVFRGAGAATWNWTSNAESLLTGSRFTFKNATTHTLTFNLAGTGNGSFDGLGKTQITLNPATSTTPGGSFEMQCSSSGFWSIVGWINCTM